MTIDEAIKILEHNYQAQPRSWYKDYFAALKLGIEALKHFKYHRDLNIISFVKQLPGETK